VFSSSKFHHGETVAQVNGNYYAISHNKIYKTDAEGSIAYDEDHHVTNEAPLDFSITKGVVSIMFTFLLMFFLFKNLADSYAKNGGIATGVGRFFEPIVLYVRDDIAIPNIGEKNLTGTKDYWLHIFDPLGSSMKWYAKVPLYIILIPIEVLGIFVKPFSLLIRLYANMQAGHIVLMSLIGLMFIFKSWLGSPLSFGLAFAISFIEVLVALLQAYIFTMLSALYFGFASEEHEHHDEIEAH
jgi:F-type H+-transporting ATPase subunit a